MDTKGIETVLDFKSEAKRLLQDSKFHEALELIKFH